MSKRRGIDRENDIVIHSFADDTLESGDLGSQNQRSNNSSDFFSLYDKADGKTDGLGEIEIKREETEADVYT
jgi:hypothetical protein